MRYAHIENLTGWSKIVSYFCNDSTILINMQKNKFIFGIALVITFFCAKINTEFKNSQGRYYINIC